MIILERAALMLGFGTLAAACGLGIVTAIMLFADTKFRRAFVGYWRTKEG